MPEENSNKDLQFSKWLELQIQEAQNRALEIESDKAIKLKEIESASEMEKHEIEKIKIIAGAQDNSERRVFRLAAALVLSAISLLGFSCYLLVIDSKFAITVFSSSITFITGLIGGFGLKSIFSGSDSDE
ncbi:hypothetical protein [Leptospira levettii]|uniref:hypothetical protein n=1 Tax=Leptospira levettii TaxID=2023178 RepID=UPI00223D0CD8|nr:hypothetical protein [Leptospira levettii]MCW7474874.1 hypothetical protein [Leptospira levettii]